MAEHSTDLIDRAAATMLDVVARAETADLAAPTPCGEYDVRRLVNHLLYWGPALEGAAGKNAVAPASGEEDAADLAAGDWPASLNAQVRRTADAWRKPDAWTGATFLGGPSPLPAEMVGAMVLGEFVIHGWDLARGTGQRPDWDPALLEHLYVATQPIAEQGREMGVFGPRVEVPASASTLDQLLGLTGRDPAWTP